MAASKNHIPRAIERERKFLVKKLPARLSRYPHELIEQGYLEQVGRETRPSAISNRFPSVTYTGPDPVTVWATAWYVWDLAGGPGGEGVFIDAHRGSATNPL